jgi:hypothetical protein
MRSVKILFGVQKDALHMMATGSFCQSLGQEVGKWCCSLQGNMPRTARAAPEDEDMSDAEDEEQEEDLEEAEDEEAEDETGDNEEMDYDGDGADNEPEEWYEGEGDDDPHEELDHRDRGADLHHSDDAEAALATPSSRAAAARAAELMTRVDRLGMAIGLREDWSKKPRKPEAVFCVPGRELSDQVRSDVAARRSSQDVLRASRKCVGARARR